MTKAQKLRTRLTALAEALNAFSDKVNGGESPTDEERAAFDTARNERADVERALAEAERDEERAAAQDARDGTDEERARIDGAAHLATYLGGVIEGRSGMSGAEAEQQAAYGLSGMHVPLAALAPRRPRDDEERADAVSAAPANAHRVAEPILGRVFADTAAMYCGVDMPTVAFGEQNYPVVGTGATADTKAVDTGGDAGNIGIASNVLAPVAAEAAILLRREDLAVLAGMEDAARAELAGALGEEIDKVIVAGSGVDPDPAGLLDDGAGITTQGDPGNVAAFADFITAYAGRVDGRYAMSVRDVRLLVGSGTFAKAWATYRGNNSAADMSAGAHVEAISGGFRVSAHVPAAAGNIQLALAAMPNGGRAAVAPVWEGVQIIADEVSQARKRHIRLTAFMLYSFKVLRTAQFYQAKFQLA